MPRREVRDVGLALRMAVALVVIGLIYLVGESLAVALAVAAWRDGDVGASLGGLIAVAAIPALVYGQVMKGGALALRAGRARLVESGGWPDLERVLAQLAALADVPEPRLAVVLSPSSNAFAVARPGRPGVVAVTEGLVARLDERQLEAVLAHELAHLANRDGLIMPVVGGPALLGPALRREASDDRRAWILYALYLPVYALGLLLMRMVSRAREYVADRDAALLTGAPEQLASALLVLADAAPPKADLRGGAAVQALCIVPTHRVRLGLLAGHPPVHKRVERLERLARGER